MGRSGWIRWQTGIDKVSGGRSVRINNFRIKTFRLLMLIGLFFLSLIIVRALFVGEHPLMDICNFVVFLVLFVFSKRYPEKIKLLSWISLAALICNVFDGAKILEGPVITPAYILFPLIVLYGILLWDVSIVLVSFLCVSGIFIYSAVVHYPLGEQDFMILTNLMILLSASTVSAAAIFYQHFKLEEAINRATLKLQDELDTNTRLSALVFHDICNPLTALEGTLQLMQDSVKDNEYLKDNLLFLRNMTNRIASIIESARGIGTGRDLLKEPVSIKALFEDQKKLFQDKLKKKNQKLILDAPDDLFLMTNKEIMRTSIIGNFISNAVKFSPSGSEIKLKAEVEADNIRISVIDHGKGFSEELLNKGRLGMKYSSQSGTEGELGTAYGLIITSICLRKLGGALEIRNLPEGGAEVSALFFQYPEINKKYPG